jgi:hypothetical protein
MRKRLAAIRNITSWLIFAAALSYLVSDRMIKAMWPTHIGYALGPRAPELMYDWCLRSLAALAALSLFSLPRWQSFVGLALVVLFAVLAGQG